MNTLLFRGGTSRLHRANPLTKLAGLLWAVTAAFALPWQGAIALAIVFAVWGGVSGVGREFPRRLVIFLGPLTLALILIHAILMHHPDSRALGPLAFSWEGMMHAVKIVARLAAVVASSYLFVATTHPSDLLKAMDARGFPPAMSYLIASPLLLTEMFAMRTHTIRDAQRARGLAIDGSFWTRLRALPPLLFPVVTIGLVEADQRAASLTARGFRATPKRTIVDPPADSAAGIWLRRALVLAAIAQVGVGIWR